MKVEYKNNVITVSELKSYNAKSSDESFTVSSDKYFFLAESALGYSFANTGPEALEGAKSLIDRATSV